MFLCAGDNESFSFAKSVGVGLIDSAFNIGKILSLDIPEHLIFIGSAGSYSRDIAIFDIFHSFSGANIELSMVEENSYTPINNFVKMEMGSGQFGIYPDFGYKKLSVSHETKNSHFNSAVESYTDSHISHVVVNCSNYITTNWEVATKLYRAGFSLENMEFFSILRAAQLYRIPCVGIFCVTNYCDKNAHSDFIKNHAKAKGLLEKYVRENYAKYI